MKGNNERLLYEILNDTYPGEWVKDAAFIEGRKYRGDAVNHKHHIVIEIDGGMYPFYYKNKYGQMIKAMQGGHTSPEGIQRDMNKLNAAQIAGWKLLRYTPDTLKDKPYIIIRDIRMLCGASSTENQTFLCLDAVKPPGIQVQRKL